MADYHSQHTGQIIDATISAVIAGKAGIQGIKVNGTDITPDSETNKVDLSIPTVSNYTATLSSSSWTESSGTYTQTVSIPGILSSDTPIIDVSNPTKSMLDSWSYVSKIETSNDSITATCFSNQPTENINIKLMVVR